MLPNTLYTEREGCHVKHCFSNPRTTNSLSNMNVFKLKDSLIETVNLFMFYEHIMKKEIFFI